MKDLLTYFYKSNPQTCQRNRDFDNRNLNCKTILRARLCVRMCGAREACGSRVRVMRVCVCVRVRARVCTCACVCACVNVSPESS